MIACKGCTHYRGGAGNRACYTCLAVKAVFPRPKICLSYLPDTLLEAISVEPRSHHVGDIIRAIEDDITALMVLAYYYRGMSHEEIAQVFGVTRTTVGRRISNVLHKK